MAKNILVISCDYRETRVALIESGIIAELHIERKGRESGNTVGNVYLGKVTRVLPGLQAAFIDIGQERAAFLHVEDLIRPDDFDEYLAGGRKLARGEGGGASNVGAGGASPEAEGESEEAEAVAAEAEIDAAISARDLAAAADAEAGGGDVAADDRGEAVASDSDDDQDDDEEDRAEAAASDSDQERDEERDEEREEEESDSDDEARAEDSDDEEDDEEPETLAQGAAGAEPLVVTPLRTPVDDLEATVSYPDWPAPPAKRVAGKRPNGKTTAKRALGGGAKRRGAGAAAATPEVAEPVATTSEPPPDSDPPSTQAAPPSTPSSLQVLATPSPSSSVIGFPTSSHAVVDEDEDDDDDDLDDDGLDDDEDDAPSRMPSDDASTHSFNSAPTLDELPKSDSDRPVLASPTPAAPGDVDDDEEEDELLNVDADDDDDLPGFTVTEPGEPVPRAPAPRSQGGPQGARERGERGGRRRRRGRGGRGGDRPAAAAGGGGDRGPQVDTRGGGGGGGGGGGAPAHNREGGRGRGRDGGRDGGRGGRGRSDGRGPSRDRGGRPAQGLPGRLSKSTPIREVVKEGQEIIVQVTKDPIGTKGARCSSHISLPGRYVVYLPTVDHIGISKRIGNDKERARLREAIEAMKPPSGGLIVRTVAEGLTKKGLKADVGYLVRLWGEIAKKREGARAPNLLSSELDLVLKVARDLFTDEVDEVVIDDKDQYQRLCRFVEMFAPDRVKDVKLYNEEEPIFDEYGIEDEIGRALARKVPLPSGGHLIIDQAEALTAIDVNTGRFVGKGSKDMEETILKTNLEAVNEIAYQLRFRNIGGLIILDLIDMEQHKSREKVRRTLEELLHKDKAKTTLNRISDLGLIEMTRKRTRDSLGRMLHEPCFYCDGTGQLQSKETIAYEILREIRRKRSTLPGYSVVVNAHPAVADVLNGSERGAVQDAENKYMRKIVVASRKEYHLEQFDLQGK